MIPKGWIFFALCFASCISFSPADTDACTAAKAEYAELAPLFRAVDNLTAIFAEIAKGNTSHDTVKAQQAVDDLCRHFNLSAEAVEIIIKQCAPIAGQCPQKRINPFKVNVFRAAGKFCESVRIQEYMEHIRTLVPCYAALHSPAIFRQRSEADIEERHRILYAPCCNASEGGGEVDAFTFGGGGYASVPQMRRYNNNRYIISLTFRTFDENALLFLCANNKEAMGDFISLELRDGKVVFQVYLGGDNHLLVSTTRRFNTGRFVSIRAERYELLADLRVDDEHIEASLSQTRPVTLELANSSVFFGGVPPGFVFQTRYPIATKPFIGCMKEIQIDLSLVDLLTRRVYHVDIEQGCHNRAIRDVSSSNSTGYLTLPVNTSISFPFGTGQADIFALAEQDMVAAEMSSAVSCGFTCGRECACRMVQITAQMETTQPNGHIREVCGQRALELLLEVVNRVMNALDCSEFGDYIREWGWLKINYRPNQTTPIAHR